MNSLIKPDFKILDGLRGIAATYVVINHCRGNLLIGGREYAAVNPIDNWSLWEKLYYSALQSTSLGREFVIIFFVLSGFSIAHSLNYTTSLSKFYQRRALRLYPPYITALLWAYVVFMIISTITPLLTENQLSVFANPTYTVCNLLYIPSGALIGQFWSLTHEVIFYLLIPVAILKRRIYYLLSLLLFITGWFINWNAVSGASIAAAFIFDYNFYFAIGVYLYFNYSVVEKYFLVSRVKMLIVSIVLVCAMVIIKFNTNDENKITLLMAAFLSLVLIINFQDKKITNKLLLFLGSMSYTIYITHVASVFLFKSLILKFGLVNSISITNKWIWIIGIFFCIIISYCIYLISERPTKSLLNYLRNRERKRPNVIYN